jgi:hypothetical protein
MKTGGYKYFLDIDKLAEFSFLSVMESALGLQSITQSTCLLVMPALSALLAKLLYWSIHSCRKQVFITLRISRIHTCQ